MQKLELRCAGDRSDFTLLVATLSPPVVETVTELFALPLLPRSGGFLACVPYGVLDESWLVEGVPMEMTPTWLGIGAHFDVPLIEEGDDGTPIPIGMSGPVQVIDVNDEFLNFARVFDPVTDADIDIVPYHPDNTSCIPSIEPLLRHVKEWLQERTDQMASFYSAQEDPDVSAKAKPGQKKASGAPKRVTNAALMDQLSALTTQLQVLSARQDVLENAQAKPKPAEAAGEPSYGNRSRLPDLSVGLRSVEGPMLPMSKALQVVGPPPRIQRWDRHLRLQRTWLLRKSQMLCWSAVQI